MRGLALCIALCSCSQPDVLAARKLPAGVAADAADVAAANNQFACDLYHQLPQGNVILSPFSISTALAMLDAGAANATDAELRAALHFDLPGDQLHAAYGALLASLKVGGSYGNYTLATADRLFGQQGFAFLPSFLATTKQDYGAELLPVDFEGDADGARGTINGWVASHTDNKIPELFAPGSLDASTRLVLANAIVFQGSWASQFDPRDTVAADFQLADGTSVSAPIMHEQAAIATAAIPHGQLGVLPFAGKDLAFVVLLPDRAADLPLLEAELTGDALAGWLANARPSETADVGLPKFTSTASFELAPTLQALGITSAFDPTRADFSALDGAYDLSVATAVHQAVISVDEHGAEAAAATGVGVTITALPPPFVADHSFVYLIYDEVTGSILFMGRLADPTAR